VWRFVVACVTSGTLTIGLGIAAAAAAPVATAQPAHPAVSSPVQLLPKHTSTLRIRRVDLATASRAAVGAHPALAAPLLFANPGLTSTERAATIRSGGTRTGLKALAPSAASTAAGSTEDAASTLIGSTEDAASTAAGSAEDAQSTVAGGTELVDTGLMSLDEQVDLFGSDQELQPPSTQVAAGPNYLVEVVNDSLSVYSKQGVLVNSASYDLNALFDVPSGYYFTDPHVLYDLQSGRFFMSGWALDSAGDSVTYLAVSASADPTGTWNIYEVNSYTAEETDEPMLGVCDDKVVMSWNDFTPATSSTAATFQEVGGIVLQKSDLLAGVSPGYRNFVDPDGFGVVPARSLSPTTTCWATVNDASSDLPNEGATSPSLGVISFTGTPDAGNLALNETFVPITATTVPPAPEQPSGSTNDSLNDDRLLSTVWQDGNLWTSATEGCTPTGDTAVRNCMRLIEVTTSSATPTLEQDFDLSTSGVDEYYPAVTLDGAGDLYVSYTASSPTLYPGAYAVISPASSIGSFTAPLTIDAGTASYDGGATPRWGDYSSAAPDPSDPYAAWVAAEYAPSDAATGDWATAAAAVTLAATPPAWAAGAEGGNGELYVQQTQASAGWQPFGGQIEGAPAVAAPPNANGTTPDVPVFIATGSNGELWETSDGSDWEPVGPDGALCIGSPAAVVTGTGTSATLTVACEGLNRSLYYNTTTMPSSGLPSFTSPWTSLGGVLRAGPAVAAVDGVVTLFAEGTNGQVFTNTGSGYTATPWICTGTLAAATQPTSGAAIFACQGGDHSLWTADNDGAGWLSAVSLGGQIVGGPGIVASSQQVEFFVEGSNGNVWEWNPFSGWGNLGGIVIGGVGASAEN
jgi:hypothetical protein